MYIVDTEKRKQSLPMDRGIDPKFLEQNNMANAQNRVWMLELENNRKMNVKTGEENGTGS